MINHPNRNRRRHIDHMDGNPRNNDLDNLRIIPAKFAGRCLCGCLIGRGDTITWDREAREVSSCVSCRKMPEFSPFGGPNEKY